MPPITQHSFFEIIFLKFKREKGHRGKTKLSNILRDFFFTMLKNIPFWAILICLCKKRSAHHIYFLVRFSFILVVLVLKHAGIYGCSENMNLISFVNSQIYGICYLLIQKIDNEQGPILV